MTEIYKPLIVTHVT